MPGNLAIIGSRAGDVEAAPPTEAISLWADDPSRSVFANRLANTSDHGDSPAEMSLFLPEFLALPQEILVDCGSGDGEGFSGFIRDHGGQIAKLVAIEPNPLWCMALIERIAESGLEEKVVLFDSALASEPGWAEFDDAGHLIPSAETAGADAVRLQRLDVLLKDETPSYIWIDLGGSAMDALGGAIESIVMHRPVVAVVAYDRRADLWEIPLFFEGLEAEYRYFLRACGERTICYAVPFERVL